MLTACLDYLRTKWLSLLIIKKEAKAANGGVSPRLPRERGLPLIALHDVDVDMRLVEPEPEPEPELAQNDGEATEGAKEPSEDLMDQIEEMTKVLSLLAEIMGMVVAVSQGPSVPGEQLPCGELMLQPGHTAALLDVAHELDLTPFYGSAFGFYVEEKTLRRALTVVVTAAASFKGASIIGNVASIMSSPVNML